MSSDISLAGVSAGHSDAVLSALPATARVRARRAELRGDQPGEDAVEQGMPPRRDLAQTPETERTA